MGRKIRIAITNQQQVMPIKTRERKRLQKTIETVLQHKSVPEGEVSLAIVDDKTIARLAKEYFGRRQATDVISFDLREKPPADSNKRMDCEVVVNAQEALRRSRANAIDAWAELNLYVVHGLLHQMGYNDQQKRQARLMHAKEDELLEALGLGKVFHYK